MNLNYDDDDDDDDGGDDDGGDDDVPRFIPGIDSRCHVDSSTPANKLANQSRIWRHKVGMDLKEELKEIRARWKVDWDENEIKFSINCFLFISGRHSWCKEFLGGL